MEIYDVPELAEMLQTDENTIRSYLKHGRLTGRKVGRRWLVCEDALRAFFMNPVDSQANNKGNIPTNKRVNSERTSNNANDMHPLQARETGGD